MAGIPRKKHEVGEAAQKLYDGIIKSFDPTQHVELTGKHDKAYHKHASGIAGKSFGKRDEAIEALIDAVIKYRKDAGIPVSTDKADRHRVYGEVQQYIALADQGKLEGLGNFETIMKSGKLAEMLNVIHQNETQQTLDSKVEYHVAAKLPEDGDPSMYQDVWKAHENAVGVHSSKGSLAKVSTKNDVVSRMKNLYKTEVERMFREGYQPPAKKAA